MGVVTTVLLGFMLVSLLLVKFMGAKRGFAIVAGGIAIPIVVIFGMMQFGNWRETVSLRRLESTPLNFLEVAGMKVGDELTEADITSLGTQTQPADVSEGNTKYWFEDIRVMVDSNNRIIQISVDAYGELFPQFPFATLADTVELLGENYLEGWYDREQGLRAYTWVDREAGLKFSIIYATGNSNKIVWFVLEKF